MSEYGRQHYKKNKALYIERARLRTKRYRAELKSWINKYKESHGCSKCPENDPACLDFHHLGNKEITIAKAIKAEWSMNRLKPEIDKCIVLCANCHRKLHASRV